MAGRIVVKQNQINDYIEKISNNFDVIEIEDFFKQPTKFGYRGINIKVKLPNAMLAEIQIHTPESLLTSEKIHPIYKKWRNKDLNKLSKKDLEQMNIDINKSQLFYNQIKNLSQPAGEGKAEIREIKGKEEYFKSATTLPSKYTPEVQKRHQYLENLLKTKPREFSPRLERELMYYDSLKSQPTPTGQAGEGKEKVE